MHAHLPSGTDAPPPPSGWTDTSLSVRLRRGAGGSVRVDGVLCAAPVWFRWDGATLWLVGSGASPVGEDRVRVSVDVGPGVEVAVRSVAATVVYAARGDGTRWETDLRVGPGAVLDWRPEPMILTGRARHENRTTVRAARDAEVVVDEVLVLGRAGESTGSLRSTLDVRVGDEPVLLTALDTSVAGWDGPAGVAGRSVVGNRLRLAPEERLPTAPTSPGAALLGPAPGCRLAVATSDGVTACRSSMDGLLPADRPS